MRAVGVCITGFAVSIQRDQISVTLFPSQPQFRHLAGERAFNWVQTSILAQSTLNTSQIQRRWGDPRSPQEVGLIQSKCHKPQRREIYYAPWGCASQGLPSASRVKLSFTLSRRSAPFWKRSLRRAAAILCSASTSSITCAADPIMFPLNYWLLPCLAITYLFPLLIAHAVPAKRGKGRLQASAG